MHQYITLKSDSPISAEQLEVEALDGWEFVQSLAVVNDYRFTDTTYIHYFKRVLGSISQPLSN